MWLCVVVGCCMFLILDIHVDDVYATVDVGCDEGDVGALLSVVCDCCCGCC